MTRFTVNGNPVHYKMDPQTPLLWALRDASNLTGTKYGCGLGQCGACTVHVDGVAQRSCQLTIRAYEEGVGSIDQIDAAITNLCRCGSYPRIHRAIQRAAEMLAGGDAITAAPPPGIAPADAAAAVPALRPPGNPHR